MKLRFDAHARREIDEAYQWYEAQQPGLGLQYVREVEDCTRIILRLPLAATEIAPGIRRSLTRRFPYGILYRIQADTIFILAVMHLHRRHGYWQDR